MLPPEHHASGNHREQSQTNQMSQRSHVFLRQRWLLSDCASSQSRIITFPLLLQLSHESNEPLVLPQVVQVGIVLKQRITGEAIIGSGLQPFNRLLRFLEQGVRRSN